jgi:predicted nucleic acid-binding protein
MRQVCLDASVAAKLVLKNERFRTHARQLFADAASADGEFIAPPIFVTEIDSIVRRREHERELTTSDAQFMYRKIDEMDVTIVEPPGLRFRAREIAREFDQERVYDSTYAALAELRGCEFWTADRVFHNTVKKELPFVRYLAEYPIP